MTMTITVKIADQYGNKVIKPVCDKAKTFAAIANTKTLTKETILLIKSLGYEVSLQADSIESIMGLYAPNGALA